MQFRNVMLKSGAIFAFDINYTEFSFNEKGYFVGDGLLSPRGYSDGFSEVKEFTFHMNEISCHWLH